MIYNLKYTIHKLVKIGKLYFYTIPISTTNPNEAGILGGGHAIFLTGIDNEYVYIASWGKEYKVSLNDFINNSFEINAISVNENSNDTVTDNSSNIETLESDGTIESLEPQVSEEQISQDSESKEVHLENIREDLINASDDKERIRKIVTLSSSYDKYLARVFLDDDSNSNIFNILVNLSDQEKIQGLDLLYAGAKSRLISTLSRETMENVEVVANIINSNVTTDVYVILPKLSLEVKEKCLKYLDSEDIKGQIILELDESKRLEYINLLNDNYKKFEIFESLSEENRIKCFRLLDSEGQINIIKEFASKFANEEGITLPYLPFNEDLIKTIINLNERNDILKVLNLQNKFEIIENINLKDQVFEIEKLSETEKKMLVEKTNDDLLKAYLLVSINDDNLKSKYISSLSKEGKFIVLQSIKNKFTYLKTSLSSGLSLINMQKMLVEMRQNGTLLYNKNFSSNVNNYILKPLYTNLRNCFKYFANNADGYYGADQNATRKFVSYRLKDVSFLRDHFDIIKDFLVNEKKLNDNWVKWLQNIKNNSKISIYGYEVIEEFINKYANNDPIKYKELLESIVDTTPIVSDEYIRLQEKLKSMGLESEVDQRKILNSLDTTGICSYAACANVIFARYLNKPFEFQKDFGFSMTRTINGKEYLNSSELLLDMYLYFNCNGRGGDFFTFDELGKLRISDYYQNNNGTHIDTENQFYLSDYKNGVKVNWLNNYLAHKGIDLEFSNSHFTFEYDNDVNGKGTDSLELVKSFIIQNLQGGNLITLGIYRTPKEFKLISTTDENRFETCGSHEVFVTGIDNEYVYVASWGHEYKISLENFAHNKFDISLLTITNSSHESANNALEEAIQFNQDISRSGLNKNLVLGKVKELVEKLTQDDSTIPLPEKLDNRTIKKYEIDTKPFTLENVADIYIRLKDDGFDVSIPRLYALMLKINNEKNI